MEIQLSDQKNIRHITWAETQEAKQAKTLLLPMLEQEVEAYIRNVDTDLYLLKVDKHILLITVNTREFQNSYLTSNYFPIKYLEKILSQKYPHIFWVQKPFIQTL